jgi:hypothetical protein
MLAGSTQALWVESIANDRIDNPMKPDFIVTVALYPVDRGRNPLLVNGSVVPASLILAITRHGTAAF